MYAARRAGSIPRATCALARATFAEMALAGITAVGEFHYLHHGPGGEPVRRSERDRQGADRRRAARPGSGSRCSTPATCTAASASRSNAVQRRFADADADAWAERVDALAGRPTGSGSAPRSTASAPSIPTRRRRSPPGPAALERPLHAHVSEQPAENEACLDAYGATPTGVLERAGALGDRLHRRPRHPPRPTPTSPRSAAAGCCCCLCPTTERDLADGIGPARALRRRRRRRWRSAPTRTR